jgi:hypothetical protein
MFQLFLYNTKEAIFHKISLEKAPIVLKRAEMAQLSCSSSFNSVYKKFLGTAIENYHLYEVRSNCHEKIRSGYTFSHSCKKARLKNRFFLRNVFFKIIGKDRIFRMNWQSDMDLTCYVGYIKRVLIYSINSLG